MTTAYNPLQEIEDWFKDYKRPEAPTAEFDYLVGVCGRIDSPGPRDERWTHIIDYGRYNIEKVLNLEPIGAGPHFFVFPDRWLVPAEAQDFHRCLLKNPDASKFDRVYVVTHQPYLVGSCRKEQCRIITKDS